MRRLIHVALFVVLAIGAETNEAAHTGMTWTGPPHEDPCQPANEERPSKPPKQRPSSLPKQSDLLLGQETKAEFEKVEKLPSNETVKTVERRVIRDTDETGENSGNETVIEKRTETDVKAINAYIARSLEIKTVNDKEGEKMLEKTVIQNTTLTERTPDNATTTVTVQREETADEEGHENLTKETQREKLSNGTNEKTVEREKKKEVDRKGETVNVTVTETKVETDITRDKHETRAQVGTGVLDKKDEPQNVKITEKKTEILPGIITKKVLVKEKAEKLPSDKAIQEKSIESITQAEGGKVGEKIIPAVSKNVKKVAPSVTGETVSVPKTEVRVVKTVVPVATKEKVTEKKVPLGKEEKLIEKVLPSVKEKVVPKEGQKVVAPVVKGEKVDEKVVLPSVKEEQKGTENVPIVKENVLTEEKETGKDSPVVKEKVVEIVVPSVKEEEKVIEKIVPVVKDETSAEEKKTGEETPIVKAPIVKEKLLRERGKAVKRSVPRAAGEEDQEENLNPRRYRRSVIIAGAVKGDDRPGPFEIVRDVKLVKVVPVVKSGNEVVKVLPPVTKQEVLMEKITPVAKVGGKFIPRGASVVVRRRGITPAEEEMLAAKERPRRYKVVRVVKVSKVVPIVTRGDEVIKTLPSITKEEVISEKVVPVG